MSVVVKRALLTEQDKEYIRSLTVKSTTEDGVAIAPYLVKGEEVILPLASYLFLARRKEGERKAWPLSPNDALVPARFGGKASEEEGAVIPSWQFTGTLRDYQVQVASEAIPLLLEDGSILLSLYCGWGKTLFTAYLSSKAQLPTLILYHISPLGKSWPTTFSEFTNATVCHLNEQPFNPQAQIFIATVGLALSEEFPLKRYDIGMLVIDEMHCFCSPKRITSLLQFSPKYLILLTATPEKANGMGKLIEHFASRRVVRISERPFTVVKCQTKLKPKLQANVRGGLDWQEVKNSLMVRPELISLIVEWVTSNPERKILIPCIQKKQSLELYQALQEKGEDVQLLCSKDKTYEECRVLVATVHKTGVGFDDATTCRNYSGRRFNMLILAWTFKDQSFTEQVIGRMREDHGVVIDIVHDFSSFQKHFASRAQWYLSHKGKIIYEDYPKELTC